jgi:hypothetical protein
MDSRCCTFLLYKIEKGPSLAPETVPDLGGRYWDRTSDLFGVNVDAAPP